MPGPTSTRQAPLGAVEEDPGRCEAIAVWASRRCSRKAIPSHNYCTQHLREYFEEADRD